MENRSFVYIFCNQIYKLRALLGKFEAAKGNGSPIALASSLFFSFKRPSGMNKERYIIKLTKVDEMVCLMLMKVTLLGCGGGKGGLQGGEV